MTEQTEQKPGKIFAALLQVKKHLATAGVGKDRKNTQQGYSFRGIDDILNAMAAPLVNAGITILPRVNSRTSSVHITEKKQLLTSVALDTDFIFVAEDGSSVTARIQSEASDYADKATNKAISFGMKYAFIAVFNIPVVGADEGDFESPGNEVDQPAVAAAPQAVASKSQKGGKKSAAKAAPAADAPPNEIVKKLQALAPDVANKVALLIQKAYNVASVSLVPADKIAEAIGRIDGYLKKAATGKGAAKPATQAQSADEIPE